MEEETISLSQYLMWRCMGHVSLKSLTKKEAELIGVPYPLRHGWSKKYKHLKINKAKEVRLKEILASYRQTKQAQQAIRRAEKRTKSLIDKERAPLYDWSKPEEPKVTVYRVPKYTITPRPERKVTASEQKAAAQKFFSSSMAFVATDEFLSSFEWRKIRMQALKKYGARCMCCGATPQTGAVMNVDHIKPRKIYPELALNLDNLQILCHDCNHGKGNWDMTDWRSGDKSHSG